MNPLSGNPGSGAGHTFFKQEILFWHGKGKELNVDFSGFVNIEVYSHYKGVIATNIKICTSLMSRDM